MKVRLILASILAATLTGCGGEKKEPVYIDVDTSVEESVEESDNVPENTQADYEAAPADDEVRVPFRARDGVKYVQVEVNGVGFEMIFDTGCSNALISLAEANYLYQKGKLTDEDIVGVTQAQVADGSLSEGLVVNLKEVIVGGQILCNDVTAIVTANVNDPLLLGNDVLDRVSTVTIDNTNQTLNFKLK